MRSNMFGEKIAQPDDDRDICMMAWEYPSIVGADLFEERDETFGFGGELRGESGEGFYFDGFDSVDDARKFALQFVPEWDISVI